MKPLPDNLADADLALLYMSDEMPAGDRMRFAARLAAELPLRQQVERMNAEQASVFGVFDRVDATTPLPSAFVAARRIGDATPAAAGPSVPARRRWQRVGRWMIVPAAAAAVLALGLAGWYLSIPPDEDAPVAVTPDDSPSLLALRPGAGGDPSTMTDDQILQQFDPIVVEPPADTERQAAALLYLDKALPTEKALP